MSAKDDDNDAGITPDRYQDDFCWSWTVSVESWDEFEVAECECNEPHIEFDNSFCESWTCYEAGMHKRHNSNAGHFATALVLWAILGGLCLCTFTVRFTDIDDWWCWIACGGCCWFCLIGFAAIAHGGFPCFILWISFSILGCILGACWRSMS